MTDLPDEIYCDGGCVGANPSKIGGTWAWCWVAGGEVVRHDSGVITTEHHGLPATTNNVSELWAALEALASVPHDWPGTLYTDSRVTWWRVTTGRGFDGVPHDLMLRTKKRRRGRRYEVVLLKGHPTKKHLEAGFHPKGLPVSKWNCWCDEECGRVGKAFLGGAE